MKRKLFIGPGRSQRGFTIMECMAMLPVMAVFFMMAGQLFVTCLENFSKADIQATELSQRRELLRTLRQDVATAVSVQIQGSHGLICRFGNKGVILWLANADGTVTCLWQKGKLSPRPQYWPRLLRDFHFAHAPNGCVNVCWRNGNQSVTQTLDSPMILADTGKTGDP